MEDFSKPKIVWTPVNSEYRFTYLAPGIFFNNSLFMITGEQILSICGTLNSKAYRLYLSLLFGRETYMYGSRDSMIFAAVPKQEKFCCIISKLVQDLLIKASRKTIDSIDKIVYDTLHLSNEEIDYIETHYI